MDKIRKDIIILDPTSDIVFKEFMTSVKTINFKARLLHLITGIDEEALKHADYTIKELVGNNKNDKTYRTDIIVSFNKTLINIEMNHDYYKNLLVKNNQYINILSSKLFHSGDKYDNDNIIIQISMDNFSIYPVEKLVHQFGVLEIKDYYPENPNEIIIKYHIDLEYLRKKCYNSNKLVDIDKLNELERLLLMFIINNKENLDKIRGEKIMEEAKSELERISSDEDIIGLYDVEAIERKVMNTRLYEAEEKGREEGKKEGSVAKTIEIARNFKKSGIDINVISENTGLSISEIENL